MADARLVVAAHPELWAEARRPGSRSARHTDARSGSARTRRWTAGVLLAALGAAVVAAVLFATTGGHWYVVRTPSMGRTAPVGTLLLTRPTTVAQLHVGDIIAFHPASTPDETYTHRVVALHGRSVTTRGDINGSDDPWATTDHDIIGRTVAIWPGVGYLVRALPLLMLGGLVVVGLTRWWVTPALRGPLRLLGFTGLYLVTALVIRPFVGVVHLATQTGDGTAEVISASTGILPVRVRPAPGHGSGRAADLVYGQVGSVRLSKPPASGTFQLDAALHLVWWQWLIAGVVCALPTLWVLLVGFRPKHDLFGMPA